MPRIIELKPAFRKAVEAHLRDAKKDFDSYRYLSAQLKCERVLKWEKRRGVNFFKGQAARLIARCMFQQGRPVAEIKLFQREELSPRDYHLLLKEARDEPRTMKDLSALSDAKFQELLTILESMRDQIVLEVKLDHILFEAKEIARRMPPMDKKERTEHTFSMHGREWTVYITDSAAFELLELFQFHGFVD